MWGRALDRFRAVAGSGGQLTVGCTQEAALFREVTEDSGADIRFVNLRESAGWSTDAAKAGPKMAALAAAGAEPMPGIPFVQLESAGVVLVYGRDERAIEAAGLLKDHLAVTVLLTRPDQIIPPRTTDLPIANGQLRTANAPRQARSSQPAITARSTRRSVPAAASVPRPVRPAPRVMLCRRPTRCCAKFAHCSWSTARRAAPHPSCCSTMKRMAAH